jgi:Hemerythrin HHE cation binding domain
MLLEETAVTKVAGGKPGEPTVGAHPVGPGAGPRDSRDVAAVSGVHAEILNACDRLESICDSLPHAFSRVDCLEMSAWLDQAFPELIEQEEGSLVRMTPPLAAEWDEAARTWRRHHKTDVTYAGELAEALEEFARRDQPGAVDTLSYMMRGFFEAVRRHVAYEDILVAHVAGGAEAHDQRG